MRFVLVSMDAQYMHTNLAVRYISAYLGKNGLEAGVLELSINQRMPAMLETLYTAQADVYMFSVYIWNTELVQKLAQELKKVLPKAIFVAGGPEVSYSSAKFLRQNPAFLAVVCGEGEVATLALCKALQNGENLEKCPSLCVTGNGGKIFTTPPAELLDMDELPFAYTRQEMQSGRILYYESMRGCPFSCSYCLSSVEKGVRKKSLTKVYGELEQFLEAKPRQVKFVDRTFNCNKHHALAVWKYLKENDNGVTNFHFELGGELLDEEMLSFLAGVRAGLFQFEIGVQTVNEQSLAAISRPANLSRLFGNVAQLRSGDNIHIHLDLIAGLPYEDFESFGNSFNAVYKAGPHQLQLGILKVLSGSAMQAKAEEYGILYTDSPPFEVLQTHWLSYKELVLLGHIAHVVELYHNSGRFSTLAAHLCKKFVTPFEFYHKLGAYFAQKGHGTAPLSKMGAYELLADFMQSEHRPMDETAQWLCRFDLFLHEKARSMPAWVCADGATAYRWQILEFYKNPENIGGFLPEYSKMEAKQILKTAHIEVFPFDPQSTERGTSGGICALLFNYKRRDITGRAAVCRVLLPEDMSQQVDSKALNC